MYWLEITGRDDIGTDLKAPQLDDQRAEYWSYSLVTEIGHGDLVFHYDRHKHAVVAWSRVVGQAWEEDIVWGARGGTARRANVTPYLRPGWKLGLTDHAPVFPAVTLEEFRSKRAAILNLESQLQKKFGHSVYMPFVRYADTLRAQQGYLTKFPSEMVGWFPPLEAAAQVATKTAATPSNPAPMAKAHTTSGKVGTTYRRANESVSVSKRDPMSIDPAIVERGTQGHARAQNMIADAAEHSGFEPRSPSPGEPNFDLCWDTPSALWVVEVKSITDENEERQLRLGLGQVLRYRALLGTASKPVRAAVMAERKPKDEGWHTLFKDLGVTLLWPNLIEKAGNKLPSQGDACDQR